MASRTEGRGTGVVGARYTLPRVRHTSSTKVVIQMVERGESTRRGRRVEGASAQGGAKGWAMGARAGQTFYRCSEQDGRTGERGVRGCWREREALPRGERGTPDISRAGSAG